MGAVVKKSVSVPDIIWSAAEAEAEASHTTVSALVAEGLEYLLAIRAGQHAVRDWEAEHGAFTPEEIAEADAALDAAGVTRPVSAADLARPDERAHLRFRRSDRRRA